jgi:hypothetical protein
MRAGRGLAIVLVTIVVQFEYHTSRCIIIASHFKSAGTERILGGPGGREARLGRVPRLGHERKGNPAVG